VTLNGAGSSDPDNDPLTYHWSFVSVPAGSSAELSNPITVSPTFVPDKPGTYVVGLVVNDGFVDSTQGTVQITAVQTAQWSAPARR